MKINRLEAHDRLEYLVENQSANIFQGAEDCLKKNPLSLAIQEKCPYIYIFAHPRTLDIEEKAAFVTSGKCTIHNIPEKVMVWQPRMSVPEAQENSYLFRAISKTDNIEVCWLLPPREVWDQYKKGNVTESDWCMWSINQFLTNKKGLEKPHDDDLSEERAKVILKAIIDDHREKIRNKSQKISTLPA